MSKKIKLLSIASFLLFFIMTACDTGTRQTAEDETTDEPMEESMAVEEETEATAMAQMGPASGSNVNGTITFEMADNAVQLTVDLQGVPPGTHAIHLHENGDCSAPDATSAGGHWNPTTEDHGHISHTDEFHYGDIGNLEVGSDSTVQFQTTIDIWTIGDGSTSDIINKSVIVHADADDFTTQPTGAAGARIACGVIQRQ
ncbi:MAG: superoxide dismutase family protein [Candidatus Cyclobacteriaceae bacterium M3_2C_046]